MVTQRKNTPKNRKVVQLIINAPKNPNFVQPIKNELIDANIVTLRIRIETIHVKNEILI
jgi:hypothetical protein